jgi:hypothetical protein
MFNWLMRRKRSMVADSDIAEARLTLSTMKLKMLTEDPQAIFAYTEGVRKVAGLLSQRFEQLSVRDVLLGRGPNWAQLDDASDDLIVAANSASSKMASNLQAVRTAAQGYSFGCLLLHHLYRLRFLSERAALHQRAGADELANAYAQFARSMAETNAGLHDPIQLDDGASSAGSSRRSIAAA